MHRWPLLFSVAIFASTPFSAFASGFKVPTLSGPVVDEATVLDPSHRVRIETTLRALKERGGPQVNVVTVDSLDGTPIEAATLQLAESWKLGDSRRDDGVILLISIQDRRLRIEVGQGLEGVLTDVESKRIIEDQVVPYFRAGRPSDGVLIGVAAILSKIAPDFVSTLGESPGALRKTKANSQRGLPWPILVLGLLFFMFSGRRGRRSGLLGALAGAALASGSSRSYGGGRGGFGGGGWSGGGGGFSGGGASGGW